MKPKGIALCGYCHEPFPYARSNHLFCCVSCRKKAYNLQHVRPVQQCAGRCENWFIPRNSQQRFCSSQCRRAAKERRRYNARKLVPDLNWSGYSHAPIK